MTGNRPRTPANRGGRNAVRAATTLLALLALGVTAAVGQEPDVPALDDHADSPGETLDTEFTPRARPGSVWKQVAGARFDGTTLVLGSATSFDTDLYAVSMRNTKLGFAGGARCRTQTAPADIVSCDAVSGNPAVGARVPVVYRFRQLKSGDRIWEPMDLGEGSDEPGYVGAIAWLDANTAVAVGGSGTYPRREPDCVTATPACIDPAGTGRAWIYETIDKVGKWRELDLSSQRAQGMGGLTAVSFNPEVDLANGIAGAAGGLGQLWEWENGTFARRVDRHSSRDLIQNRHLFRFRVRQIDPRWSASTTNGYTAVTSGCCGPTPAHNVPRVLIHTRPSTADARSRWVVDAEGLDAADPERTRDAVNEPLHSEEGCRARWPLGSTMGVDTRTLVCKQIGEHGPVPVELGGEHDETIDNGRSLGTRVDPRLTGDSFYAVFGGHSPSAQVVAVLLGAGGQETDGEQPSQILLRSTPTVDRQPPTPSLSTSRLVDADGDSAGSQARNTPPWVTAPSGRDGIPDWAVGETRAERSPFGRRGLFAATHLRPARLDTVSDPAALGGDPGGVDSYEATDERRLDRYLSAGLAQSTSYSLNAIDMVEPGGAPTGRAGRSATAARSSD